MKQRDLVLFMLGVAAIAVMLLLRPLPSTPEPARERAEPRSAPRESAARPAAPIRAPLLPPATSGPGGEVVKVNLHRDFQLDSFRVAVVHSLARLPLQKSPPPGTQALVDVGGGEIFYGTLPLGREPLRFAFALHFPAGPERSPRLYLDHDLDGNLSNDHAPIGNQGTGLFAAEVALPLGRLAPQWEGEGEYRIWLFTNATLWPKRELSYYARSQLVGEVVLAGRPYLAVVADRGVHDGDFGNDGLYLDLDGDGKIESDTEYVAPGATLLHADRSFQPRVLW